MSEDLSWVTQGWPMPLSSLCGCGLKRCQCTCTDNMENVAAFSVHSCGCTVLHDMSKKGLFEGIVAQIAEMVLKCASWRERENVRYVRHARPDWRMLLPPKTSATAARLGRDCVISSCLVLGTRLSDRAMFRNRFLGREGGQQLFSFQSPAVHWMARTSSLNCLSCRNPYQTPHSLNCLPPFHWKPLFFTEECFVASPSQESAPNVGPPWCQTLWHGCRKSTIQEFCANHRGRMWRSRRMWGSG